LPEVMWKASDDLRAPPQYRQTWVRKSVCYICKRPVVYVLRPDGKSVDRECFCDSSVRPLSAITADPGDYYEIKAERGV